MIEKYVFALDVGTRKVTGILLKKTPDGIDIKAVATIEHKTRAMLDGQIHDIPKVAEVVSAVHRKLEEAGGCKLDGASVAAAGRSLCTLRGYAQAAVSAANRLQQNDVLRLEYAAVNQAQQKLLSGSAGKTKFADQYHCVGYSVVHYMLDESPIGNLVGQRGSSAACEVIATFLPRVVVDSLRGVLELAGIKLISLTLEPIAALRMVVPEGMRRLNVVLVDIGAGTSDIAITRDGTVFAYDMVPVAGDEITEALTDVFLLDFMGAEKLKRNLEKNGPVSFKNILGEKVKQPASVIRKAMTEALDSLAEKIAMAILECNSVAPLAVFCVGGGSLTPGLTDALAQKLNMDSARVTIKGKDMVELLPGSETVYQGPELVTPLGIAYTAITGDALKFYRVDVNEQAVDVMDLGRSRVADALLAAGIGSRELVGSPGKGLSVEVNGQVVTFPGDMGELAEILVNGEPSTLEAKISEGDRVSFVPAKPGTDARVNVAVLLARTSPFCITVHGVEHKLHPPVYRGGQLLAPSTELHDRDKLRVLKTMPLSWVMEQLGMNDSLAGGAIKITLNGKEKQVPYGPRTIRVNGKAAVPGTEVSDGDSVDISEDGSYPTVSSLTEEKPRLIELAVNETIMSLPLKEVFFTLHGRDVPAETPLSDGNDIHIRVINHEIAVADILNIMNFNATPPPGQNRLVLRVNGREAQFTTVIKHGDCLNVGWTA